VGGPLLALQLAFEVAVGAVGVDHPDQVPARLGELGGIQRPGVGEQLGFAATADPIPGRE
jgi:hypothetical protein